MLIVRRCFTLCGTRKLHFLVIRYFTNESFVLDHNIIPPVRHYTFPRMSVNSLFGGDSVLYYNSG